MKDRSKFALPLMVLLSVAAFFLIAPRLDVPDTKIMDMLLSAAILGNIALFVVVGARIDRSNKGPASFFDVIVLSVISSLPIGLYLVIRYAIYISLQSV